jgi:hypothetical protein
MKFVDPTKSYRKSGGMGHPGICCTLCRGEESRMKFADPHQALQEIRGIGFPGGLLHFPPSNIEPRSQLLGSGEKFRSGQGLYHDAGFHYPGNVLHHCYIVKRIRGHGDEVSKLARLNGAGIFVQRQQLCPIDRCRL